MKRRTFIRLVGASALSLPFMHSQFGKGAGRVSPGITQAERMPLALKLAPDEAGVFQVLNGRATAAYLVGGGVLAKAGGTDLPYLNIIADVPKFGELKKDLFKYGVAPISTPTLPSSYIRFTLGERAYSVVNLGLDNYLKQNLAKSSLLPLAHNFLVFDPRGGWVLDPYGALSEKAGKGKRYRAKIVCEPESIAARFELCLASIFDSALLNLELPTGFKQLEQAVLNESVQSEKEATFLFAQVLNYLPDLIEIKGWPFARRYLNSDLMVSAGAEGPGIDLERVEHLLVEAEAKGKDVTGTMLFGGINAEFKRADKARVFGIGLPDYLAAKRMQLRRSDLFAQVMAGNETVVG